MHTYKTVKGAGTSNYRVFASKHLGFCNRCYNEADAMQAIRDLRNQFSDAHHVCYAFRLGSNGNEYRYNDDGEPSGTAGRPIYGQILSLDITNVWVAVVRYFGGTKLGTGGLIDAYGTAARMAMEAAGIQELTVMHHYRMTFPIQHLHEVMDVLKRAGMEKKSLEMNTHCIIEFAIADTTVSYLHNFAQRDGFSVHKLYSQ